MTCHTDNKSLQTPVLFIIFNKISETQQVFETIRRQQPNQLFIAADGPRIEKKGEAEKCAAIRKWVLDNIDWDCEVKTLFRDENIGCGRGPSEAITWFFENVDEGIILEDDCLPNTSFFRFCKENLEKYQNNNRISIISGNNFQPVQPLNIIEDYYFSIFPSTHGWASWKRSWEGYDFKIKQWKTIDQNKFLKFLFKEKKYQAWWKNCFDSFYDNNFADTWDFQFYFHAMIKKQLAIIPKVNLVKNIGYGSDATHTTDPNSYFANVPTHELRFPLIHPEKIIRNYEADIFIQKNLFGEIEVPSQWKKFKRLIKKAIKYQ